ncbi:tetratricopeptide repeat protein [Yinghuangia seranimata]|uniref:tetratricopeptide repeat protein n=1 Tax=Yinghuangia seranimata TaxID=408067 RepID=UPI00248B43DA|nr:tetratricopeptide repeat protein [Yinghuangia seranimata]MDI2131848.1 tetratricopeptide repeat protein [Yinghuangia seranimata]
MTGGPQGQFGTGGAAGADAGPGDGGGEGQGGGGGASGGAPQGEVYDWYRRGMALLDSGHPAAAAQLLARAADGAPESRSVREALGRALFDAGRHGAALAEFRAVAESDPADDYAQFGWGLSAARLGDFETAVEHLALAVAMRPATKHYRVALTQARATLRAREGARRPGDGEAGGRPA